MKTNVRADISKKNKYWVDKHRHYELKHFCLQYPLWKKSYSELNDYSISISLCNGIPIRDNLPSDPTASRVLMKNYYLERIELIERIAKEADEFLSPYIIKGVTENRSYTYLKTIMGIPCCKDIYYDRYRRFFWLLDRSKF